MAKVWHEMPEIVTIAFRQEKTDEDYGSCLWARFNFDTKNYSLLIESDCGSYHYGWTPTPLSETFLHLCSRFDWDYLLSKISHQTALDADATWKSIKGLVESIIDDYEMDDLDEYDWKQLESACYHNRDERDAFDSISNALDDTCICEKYETWDIWQAIETDYPVNARKICEVFRDYIQPELRMLSGYKPREDVT